MRWPQRALLFSTLAITGLVYWCLAFGTVILNGSSSLPHSGYFMLRGPALIPRGSYVAFAAPDVVADEFRQLPFVKRVAGTAGDVIRVTDTKVCVQDTCRTPLPELVQNGLSPMKSGIVPKGKIAVFGDAPNSLDSRYAAIGLIDLTEVLAVGAPIPAPSWRRVKQWIDG